MILLSLNLILNTVFVYSICNKFKNLSLFFVVFFALIILNCEILSLLNCFNSQNILILSILEAIFGIFIIKKEKNLYFPNLKEEFKKIYNSIKLDKALFVTSFAFLFMLVCFLILSLTCLPLEPDSRMYHFVRIFQYVKQGNFNHFPTNEIRNIIMPFNSEMIYSYVYVFKKNDIGFGFLSYFSFLCAISYIYLIFKQLKISIRKRLFAIFVLSSMGAFCVQIPSLQTDIVVGCLILACFYFFMLNKKSLIFFSSLALALSFGTKTTSLICCPSVIITLVGYILIYKKSFKNILWFLAFLGINFTLFSSYNYILNYLDFQNFVSPENLKYEHSIKNKEEYVYNFTYFLKDFLGYKSGFLGNFINNLQIKFLSFLNLKIQQNPVILFDERTVGFTNLGLFCFIPCLIYSFFKSKKNKFIALVSLTFLINFLIIVFTFTYSPYIIRYFITFVMISCFCMIYCYKNKFLKNVFLFICFINLILYSINSSRCPLKYYFKADFKNSYRNEVLLNMQKDLTILNQYKILKTFKENFKKEDKILLIDNIDFYELKQLSDYNIETTVLNELSKEKLKNYDYLIFKYYNEYSDNPKYFTQANKNIKCKYHISNFKGHKIPVAKMCLFGRELLQEFNFYPYKNFKTENILIYTFKNIK